MGLRIIPVLDLMDGVVVRGIAGQRDNYRPIISQLTSSAKPLDVASVLIERFGPKEIYVADLDAISGKVWNRNIIEELCSLGVSTWVDAGIRELAQARELLEAGCESIIVGLESIPGPEMLEEIVRCIGAQRVIFSLDMKGGELLGNVSAWQLGPADLAPGIVKTIVELGIRRVIVLDLAQVGMGMGTGTEDLSLMMRTAHPEIEIIVGGGIRNVEDLQRLESCGVNAALVASALHDGRILWY
jgi:phosphoribosylformimino-5-aminoimidazole carboxamide ribotide isomerase